MRASPPWRNATGALWTGSRVALLVFFALLWLSLFPAPSVPLVVKVAMVVLVIGAAQRPSIALLFVAGLTPLLRTFSLEVWPAPQPARVEEAAVLGLLIGWLFHSLRHGGRRTWTAGGLVAPALMFAAVVAASGLVETGLVQAWHAYPWPFVHDVVRFLTVDYLTATPDARPWAQWPGGLAFVNHAALLLEGVGLLLCVLTLCERDGGLARSLPAVIVFGAVGAAALSFVSVAEAYLIDPTLLGLLQPRFSAITPKLNAAASFLALALFMAAGMAAGRTRARVVWATIAILLLCSLVLTGSRTGLIAVVVGLVPMLVGVGRSIAWQRVATPSSSAIAATLVLGLGFGAFAGAVASMPVAQARTTVAAALSERAELALSGRRLVAARPLFGVGVGQFRLVAPSFASERIYELNPGAQAHNFFVQVASELGLSGVLAFIWLLWTALLPRRRPRRGSSDLERLGIMCGLTAYLVTCLGGQPLLTGVVAYPFWITLALPGVLRTRVDHVPPARGVDDLRGPGTRGRWVATTAIAFILITVPFRIAAGYDDIDFSRVDYGFYGWEAEPTGRRYRWTGARASVFVRSGLRNVVVPVQTVDPSVNGAVRLVVRVDGDVVDDMRLTDGRWRDIDVNLGASTRRRFRRIDLSIGHTFVPAVVIPDTTDTRRLGVKVGEIHAGPPV